MPHSPSRRGACCRCAVAPCASDCGWALGQGRCVGGECACTKGFHGIDCSKRLCPTSSDKAACSAHGVCQHESGACACDDGWEGADCGARSCAYNCFGHGKCVDGTCYCAPGWGGDDCSAKACPNRCSAHGACLPSAACACFDGWQGDDCSIARDEAQSLDDSQQLVEHLFAPAPPPATDLEATRMAAAHAKLAARGGRIKGGARAGVLGAKTSVEG